MKPDIYYFNPTCELAVVNGSDNYMASAKLRRFEEELSFLPGIIAQPKDIVLSACQPDQEYVDLLTKAGFILPTFQVAENLFSDPGILEAEKGFLFPWGWSPSSHKQLLPLKAQCCTEFLSSPIAQWKDIHRELYSRKAALAILNNIITRSRNCNYITGNDLPEICTTHEQIIQLQKKWEKVVVKAPWSASGRGLQILRPDEYNQTNRQVISGYIKQQGYVVVEPWHNKLLDPSFQFFSDGKGDIIYKGFTTFTTDQAGRYWGNHIQELPPDLEPSLKEFLLTNISEIKKTICLTLTSSNYSTEYSGWLGVDTMILKSTEGNFRFHPCLEINCRFTMGAIALKLRDHLAEGSVGEYKILHGKQGYFNQYCRNEMTIEPLEMDNGKIVSGFLPLTPMIPESTFGAYIKIMKE